MKKLMLIAAIGGGALLSACAAKVKVLDASMVSMTRHSLAPGEALAEKGNVSGMFCPDSFKDSGNQGLIDNAVRNAQEMNKVDFIGNVTVWRDGNGCVSIDGTGFTVKQASVKK